MFTLLALLAGAWATSAVASTPTFAEVTVHDPSVVREGGTFYVFGSHLASASSSDLRRWTQLSTTPVAGNPLAPNPTVEFAEAISWVGSDWAFWAPDVIRLPDGRFAYYYCIGRLDQPRAALGVAYSDHITGPYRHDRILLRSGPGGQPPEAGAAYDARIHPNAVDPALFYDAGGQLWMVYGSYSGGIFLLKLDVATGHPVAGQGYGKKLIGGQHARIEGAYILWHPETEYYYLFVSYGGLGAADGYNVRVGRSRTPDGPYRDPAGTDLATVAGAPNSLFDDVSIAPHGAKLMGSYQFLALPGEPRSVSRGYRSPGHNSAYYDAATGESFLVFHTRFVGRGEQHEVRVHSLLFNAAGWPVVAPHRYAGERVGRITAAQVPGHYKLINHGKAITATVANSTAIQLHADGTVTGTVAGSWQASGEANTTLVLAGVTYRGVLVRQWDDDQQVWVLGFTALSDDGVAVWGSRVGNEPLGTAPALVRAPVGATLGAGSTYALTVEATGADLRYRWEQDGAIVAGATGATLTFDALQAPQAGSYRVIVSNSEGEVASPAVHLRVVPPEPGRLINLSVRSRAGRDSATLIMGLVVNGAGTHDVLVRGLGPRLRDFDVPDALADPRLGVFNAKPELILENDNWDENLTTVMASVGAISLTPGSGDAALLAPLAAGAYTIQITSGPSTATGIALAESYDAGMAPGGRLTNVSARSQVGTGDNVLIAGFNLSGNMTKRVLIRGMGPALIPYNVTGVLADPQLRLFNSARVQILENDDWGGGAALKTAFAQAGAFAPTDDSSRDAALIATLVPGAYTVHVVGAQNTTGVALVEIYELP